MKTALFALGLAILSGIGVRAQETVPGAHVDQEIGVSFPATLGGLEYRGVRRYEQPGLGYSMRYQNTQWFKADIYVYDSGEIGITNGAEGDLVKRQAASISRQLEAMVKAGAYRDVKHIESGIRPGGGGVRFAWDLFEFIHVEKNPEMSTLRQSESYVTGFNGKFVKVRITYLKSQAEEGRHLAAEFVQGLAILLETALKTEAPGH